MTQLNQQTDLYALYERAVQCAEAEVDFIDTTFEALTGRKAKTLREDFCGTASVCCEWIKRTTENQAIGIDLSEEVFAWARQHHLPCLDSSQSERLTFQQANVLSKQIPPVDTLLAMNFSYWIFKERGELLEYFRIAKQNLVDDGVLFLDAYGGYDSFRDCEEEREIEDEHGNFTYIWEQADFNPINNHFMGHIHFRLQDGREIKPAFSYDWRFYTLPEIRELLHEAGFSKVTIYWQGWDENGEPDSEFKPVDKAEADAAWICYIAAEK